MVVSYDLETTGISTAFDQPLQFAAIHTDTELKEIERIELRCRIAPHIIPSPYALMATGIEPELLVVNQRMILPLIHQTTTFMW